MKILVKILSLAVLLVFCTPLITPYYYAQGLIWERTNGPTNAQVWAMGIDEDDVIYAADDAKLFKSTDDGDSWELVIDWTSEADEIVEIVFNDSGHIFVGTFGGAGVYRSTDKGQTWLYPAFGLPGVNDIAVGYNGDIIAGTMLNVWISTDNGYTWVIKNQGLPHQTIVVSVFVDYNENYFIGTYSAEERIYQSTDYGETWMASGNGVNTLAVISFAKTSTNVLFAGSTDAHGIHRSTDGGENWILITDGFPITAVDFILKTNSIDYVYTGLSTGGVYRSTNHGENWVEYKSGLTNNTILSLAINKEGVLFAGSWGDGVFKTIQSTTYIEEEINGQNADFILENYPNPFNSSTKINFGLPESGMVLIDIYSPSGEQVERLVDKYLPAGSYYINFTSRAISSGIYFIMLKSGANILAKKIILLK